MRKTVQLLKGKENEYDDDTIRNRLRIKQIKFAEQIAEASIEILDELQLITLFLTRLINDRIRKLYSCYGIPR